MSDAQLDVTSSDAVTRADTLMAQVNAAYADLHLNDAVDLCKEALEAGGLQPAQIDSLQRLYSDSLIYANRFTEALTQANTWLACAQAPLSRVRALIARADALQRVGDVEAALHDAHEAEGLATLAQAPRELGSALRARGNGLLMKGDTHEALTLLQEALDLHEQTQDLFEQGWTLISIGLTYHVTGRFHKSVQALLRACAISESIGDKVMQWIACNNLGESYQQIFAMDKALHYHERARALNSQGIVMVDLVRNIGVDLVAVGRVDEGLFTLLEAKSIAREFGEVDIQLQVDFSLAETFLAMGNQSESRALALELLREARNLDTRRHIGRALLILGLCAASDGDIEAAKRCFHESIVNAQQASDNAIIWQNHAALAELLASTQSSLATVHRTIAADILNGIAIAIDDRELRANFRRAPQVTYILGTPRDGSTENRPR